ncbi:hypothetical protein Vi05172_g8079 [Venturia inaequalis]|nr:hypothetical protein Vi05172_g8079 [Venturia inaequalis]
MDDATNQTTIRWKHAISQAPVRWIHTITNRAVEWKADEHVAFGITLFFVSTVVFVSFIAYICLQRNNVRTFTTICSVLPPTFAYLWSICCFLVVIGPIDNRPAWLYVGLCSAPIAIVLYIIGACLLKYSAYLSSRSGRKTAAQQQCYELNDRGTDSTHAQQQQYGQQQAFASV